MSFSSQSPREQTKELLKGLFHILETMVSNAMPPKEENKSDDHHPLSGVKSNLESVKSSFTDDESLILGAVESQLAHYRNKISNLLTDKPMPIASPEYKTVVAEIKKEGKNG